MSSTYRRLCALLLLSVCGASALWAQPGTGALPFAVQRLVIPPQRLAKELEKAPQGTLVAMPLVDFEASVVRARQGLQARDQTPRLVRAHYRAELIERSLTNASGQWTIANPGAGEAVLPIESMNLAIPPRKLRWEQGGDVLLGELDGNAFGLLVKSPGRQTCLFDWSARGTATSEGLSFQLKVPSCPLTTFEIKLPADLWLTAAKSAALVSGPLESEHAGKRVWKIQMTSEGELELTLRKIAGAQGAAPLIFAQVQSSQQLAPDRVLLDYKFKLDILHGSIRELILEGDGAVQPYDVTLRSGELESWHWQDALPPKKDSKGKSTPTTGLLTLRFRQPVQGELQGLRIRALAPVPGPTLWQSPGLWVRHAVTRGEILKVQWHPQLSIGRWDNGSFQIVASAAESDGTQLLTLADPSPESVSSRRPSLILQPSGIDLLTKETNDWQLDSAGARLTAVWDYSLLGGNLDQLTVKLPEPALGYQVEAVELKPAELLRSWHASRNFLQVELNQALPRNKRISLTLRVRAPFPDTTSGGSARTVHYPTLEPIDSTKREGTLAVKVDRIFQSRLISASLPPEGWTPAAGEENSAAPSYSFTFRDQSLQATLRLVPQPVQVRLRGRQKALLSEQGIQLRYVWEIEPLVGAPAHLDFHCSEGLVSVLRLQPDPDSLRIRRWERLYLDEALPHFLALGSGHGLGSLLLEQALPVEPLWRFYLAAPLQKKGHFTLEAKLPSGLTAQQCQRLALAMPSAAPWSWLGGASARSQIPKGSSRRSWSIPRIVPAQRLHAEQEMVVESLREPILKTDASGMIPATAQSTASPYVLTYPTDASALLSSTPLQLWTDPEKATASQNEWCDEAQLTTRLDADGAVLHQLHFRLWHWRDPTCTLHFSPAVQIVAARVQDRWLEDLQLREGRDGVRVILPIDQNIPFVTCEIYARSFAGNVLPGLNRLEQPHIDWPVKPVDFRSRYLLAQDWLPLEAAAMVSEGWPGGLRPRSVTARTLTQLWTWGGSWFPWGSRAERLEKLASQRETVLRAEAHLREKTDRALPLSEALERFALHHLQEEVFLAVDQPALRALGLAPNTLISAAAMSAKERRPFWTSLGLVYVAFPSGALLTSPQRVALFDLMDPARAQVIDASVETALRQGRDASSAFVPALLWAQRAEVSVPSNFDETSRFPEFGERATVCTAWEPLPGALVSESIYVVDRVTVELFGWTLALLSAGLWWRIQRMQRAISAFRMLLLWVLATLLALLWLPSTFRELWALPVLGMETLGVLRFLLTLPKRRHGDVSTRGSTMLKSAVQAAVLALLLSMPWMSVAQTPSRAYTVLIVDAAKPTAFVPVELKAKLEELAEPRPITPSQAVLLNATYTGQIQGAHARFEVHYDLYSAREQANLILPLTGVQLQEGVFLDGAAVYPTVHKNGYFVKVREPGLHHLRLSFSVRTTASGDHVDLRFNLPKLLQNECSLQWQAPVQSVQSFHGAGEEKWGLDSRLNVKTWHAQLGPENSVHLRWSTTTATAPPQAIEVKELHFWDLRPDSVSLWTSMNYLVGKGSLGQVTLALPEGLHVRAVEALSTLPISSAAAPLTIKHWQVQGKGLQRRLTLELAQPISNQLILNLELVPHVAFSAPQLLLSLPAPLQGKSVLGHLGYRLFTPEMRSTAQNLAVQRMAVTDFANVWRTQCWHEVPEASRAYSFQRKGIKAGLELVLQPLDRHTQADLTWHVHLHHADLSAQFTITSASDSLAMQEFSIPSNFTLVSVQGTEVSRWNLHAGRLQVWLRRPCRQVQLEIAGWYRYDEKMLTAAQRRLSLPCLMPLHTQHTPSTLRIEPVPGVLIRAERLLHLRPVPGEAAAFAFDDLAYEAIFRLEEKRLDPAAQALTRLQRSDQGLELRCDLHLTTDRGRLPTLHLHLKDWPGDTLFLEAPGANVQTMKESSPGQRHWILNYAAGLPHEVLVSVRGRVALNFPSPFKLPTLELANLPIPMRWLLWQDVELLDAASGHKIPGQPASKMRLPFDGAEAPLETASAWRAALMSGPVQAILAPAAAPPKMRLLGVREQTRLVNGQHWLHEVDYWVQVQEPASFRVVFPTATELAAVFSGADLGAAHSLPATEISLPLSAAAQPQHLRLCWRYARDNEPLTRPRLDSPRLNLGRLPPHHRLVWVPTGLTLATPEENRQPSHLEQLLDQAALQTQLAFCQASAPGTPSAAREKAIDANERAFFGLVRQGEYFLALLQQAGENTDTPRQRLHELKQEHVQRAREAGYEKSRARAEKRARTALLPKSDDGGAGSGLPLLLTDVPQRFALRQSAADLRLENHNRSEFILLLFISLLVLTFFRHSLTLLQSFSPEIVLVGALLCMGWLGVGWIGIGVVFLMLLVRCTRLAKAVRWRVAATAPSPSPSKLQPPE